MLGDGVEMDKVRHLIDEKELIDRIRLVGWVDPDGVKQHLAQSDILLMPSLREGMPMAALQALSMGLALLLPDKGSCPDLILDNGYLIEPGDMHAYASMLEKLLTDNVLLAEFKKNSRRLSSHFDISRTIDAYEQLLTKLVEKKAA